jgi:CII-binding regulator of phage lambda lysogenization HflD
MIIEKNLYKEKQFINELKHKMSQIDKNFNHEQQSLSMIKKVCNLDFKKH